MNEELKREYGELSVREKLREIGFSDLVTVVAQGVARVGARKIKQLHGVSPEQMSLVLKIKDRSAQTKADRVSDQLIRGIIEKVFPSHEINAEESGVKEGVEYSWKVDPLDGSASFSRGQKYSTVGIEVSRGEEPIVASICSPFEKELLLAEKGKGTWVFALNDSMEMTGKPQRVRVSENSNLHTSMIYVDGHFNFNTNTDPKLAFIKELSRLAGSSLGIRMTGSNIDQQRHVATGRAEVTLTDAVGGFYDLAAGDLVIREAGGMFTDLEGKPITEKTQIAIGSNGKFHEQLLDLAKKCYEGYKGFKAPNFK